MSKKQQKGTKHMQFAIDLPPFGPFSDPNLVAQLAEIAEGAGWHGFFGKMHADEVDIDSSLVARLLAGQFPQWADLTLSLVPSAGTDNAIYRLGDALAVRLP